MEGIDKKLDDALVSDLPGGFDVGIASNLNDSCERENDIASEHEKTNKDDHQHSNENGGATSTRKSTEESRMVPVLDTLSRSINGVYQFESLLYFQTVLEMQKRESKIVSSIAEEPIHWLALLYDDNCPHSSSLSTIVEDAATSIMNSGENETLYDPIFVGRVKIDSENLELLWTMFGIPATPALALISVPHPSSSSTFMVEYTGRSSTAQSLVSGVLHYFDTLSLTSQPLDSRNVHAHFAPNGNDSSAETKPESIAEPETHPLLSIQPRVFPSLRAVQTFFNTHRHRLFGDLLTSGRPVLSARASTIAERFYINWLWGDESSTASAMLLIQCRTHKQKSNDELNRLHRYHEEFDKMARALQGRRDRLFFIVQPDYTGVEDDQVIPCRELENGAVHVYEFPTKSFSTHNDALDSLLLKPIELLPSFVIYYKFGIAEEDSDPMKASPYHIPSFTPSRLVEFMIKVCTDTVLWYDKQTIAPIVFSTFRKVHAILIVDMHQDVLAAAAVAADYSTSHGKNVFWNVGTDTPAMLDDNQIAAANKRAVLHFQNICQAYKTDTARWILNDDSMVCLIVPSTETRILSTFGVVDLWYRADKVATKGSIENSNERDTAPPPVFPALLITDQRFGGTLRYYKNLNNPTDEIERILEEFMIDFWEEKLNYTVKSSKQGARTNEAGVRIITSDTVRSELYETPTSPMKEQPHALILFIAPTCGHCKRVIVLWNRLSRFLRHIGWDPFLKLFQIDVTENDVAATSLNVSVAWIPDVYYISPDRQNIIRYNVTDDLGDGVGAVRDTIEIMEWLIYDLGEAFLPKVQIERLLANLQSEEFLVEVE